MSGPPELSRRILHALARELCPRVRIWGEPPDLLFAYSEDGEVGVRGLDLPGVLWLMGPTAQVLSDLADGAERIMPMWEHVTPPGVLGVGLRCEARSTGDLDAVELSALSLAEMLVRPAENRIRFACAVDRNGNTYSVETDPAGRVIGGRIVQPADRHSAAFGSIPDALDRLLAAVLGMPMPRRPYSFSSPDNREEPDSEQDE